MSKRRIPEKLAEKLLTIRLYKQMTQGEVLRCVYPEIDQNHRGVISQFEKGRNQPPLIVLQRYAELAGIELEKLSDDTQNLPFTVSASQLSKERKRGRPQKREVEKAENGARDLNGELDKSNNNQINQVKVEEEKVLEVEKSAVEKILAQAQPDIISIRNVSFLPNSNLQSATARIMEGEDERINFSAKLSVTLLEEIDNLFWQQRCALSYAKRKYLSRNKMIEIMLQIVTDDFQTSTKDSILSLLIKRHFDNL